MKNTILFCLLLSWSVCFAAQKGDAPANDNPAKVAESFIDLLAGGQFEKADQMMTEEVVKAMPTDKLAETWKGVEETYGSFKQRESTKVEKVEQYDVVHIVCRFGKTALKWRVVLDSKRRVAGLWFEPVM